MTWTIGDVIATTLKAFSRNWVTLVVTNLLALLIGCAPLLLWSVVALPPLLANARSATPTTLLGAGVVGSVLLAMASTLVLAILFAPPLSRLALAAARGQQPRIGQLFDFRRSLTFLGAGMLTGLAIAGATLLLIVPGIIVAIGLAFVSFFVVDREVDALEALQASWTATRGHRLQLFGLFLLAGVVNWLVQAILGLTAWLLPLQLAWTMAWTPACTLALAVVYLRLVATSPQAEQPPPAV